MNRTTRTLLAKAARVAVIALAVPLALGVGAAFAQPYPYANDGGMQNASGGWDINFGFCRADPTGPGSNSRNDCRSVILSAGVAGDPLYNALYDTQAECQATGTGDPLLPGRWANGPECTNYWYRNDQTACLANGGLWTTAICRGDWTWIPERGLNEVAYNNCTICHNQVYMSGGAAGVGESYVMTGHKNMARPVVNADTAYYSVGYPWAGSNGVAYPSDGTNPIDWAAGTITVGGNPTELYWIYDGWIADYPRSIYSAGSNGTTHKPLMSYSCGRCHNTGWTSDATIQAAKQPEATFPGITWDGTTPDTTGKVNLAPGISGDTNLYSSWDQWGIQCSRCHGSLLDPVTSGNRHHPNIAGKEVTGSSSTGATRTALCMDCHRQESSGLPYGGGASPATIKVGPSHGAVGFVSHWHGNLFLNSPHARFGGTFAQINDKTQYDTHFKNEGEPFPFSGNAGGCTQCHNVHKSTVAAANPAGGAIHEECTECHAKDLNRLRHPQGRGTPIDPAAAPAEACVICHMPEETHLFRINTDPSYSTFPVAAMTGVTNANTADDDGYANAVWVDLDLACGLCHGGGSAHVETLGTVNAGSTSLTVADATGFVAGERIEVTGAGASGANLEGYVAAIAGNTITLTGAAATSVTDTAVASNPTANGAGYMSKADLAGLAAGIHDDKPMATFGYNLASPDTLTINVDASGSVCPTVCNAYSWNWGDGTPAGSGVTTSHTYATDGVYTVTLTVTEYGVGSGTVTRMVKVYTPDFPPVVDGTCTFDANTWTETVVDASTDTPPGFIRQVTVNWGDGTMLSSDITPPFGPFTHTFLIPGTFTITHKAIDNVGQQATRTCTANPAYFTVGGTVFRSDGTTPVATAMVQLKQGLKTIRTVYTNAAGAFTVGSLKPGSYDVYVTKSGYLFTSPAASVTVGPSAALSITAQSPLGGPVIGKPAAKSSKKVSFRAPVRVKK